MAMRQNSEKSTESWTAEVEKEARKLQKKGFFAEDKSKATLLWERDAQRHAESQKNRQVEKLLENEDAARASIQKMLAPKLDGAGVEWKWDKKTRWWWWRDQNGTWQSRGLSWTPPHARRPSDASSVVSDAHSQCCSVSTAATLTLSPDEEKELQKLEKRRCEIAALKERKAKGEALNRYEESAIRSEKEIDYAPVMVKVRAFDNEQAVSLLSEEPPAAPAFAPPARANEDEESPAKVPKEISLSQMVATIRRELDLDDSLTVSEVIAEANLQVDTPATGNLAQQARSLFRELSSM